MTPRQARWGVDIFTGFVTVTVALALANLTWRLTGEPGLGPAVSPVTTGSRQSVDVAPLIAMAPFGTAMMVANSTPADGSIRLKAIFLARTIGASVVLLATADGKVANYGVGSAVGGGVIESIEAEQITLRTPGGLQIIGFNPESSGPVTGGPSQTAAAPAAQPGINATSNGSLPGAPSGAASVRALIPSTVQGIPSPANMTPPPPPPPPAAAGGSGYRVGLSPPAALLRAGIRAGDVIQRVNGASVDSGTDERALMASAMARGTARVELLRNGQPISLTLPVR